MYKIGAQIVNNGAAVSPNNPNTYNGNGGGGMVVAPGVTIINTRYNQPPTAGTAQSMPQPNYYDNEEKTPAAVPSLPISSLQQQPSQLQQTLGTLSSPSSSSVAVSAGAMITSQSATNSSSVVGPSSSHDTNATSSIRTIGDISAIKPKTRELPQRFYPENVTVHAREQHPRFRTTSHAIGYRAPAAAELPREYHTLSTQFTQNFASGMHRDLGLNTSMTKSRIHQGARRDFGQ